MKAESRIYRVSLKKFAKYAATLDEDSKLRDLYQWTCGFPRHARIHTVRVEGDELVITVSWGNKDGRLGLLKAD